jgi:hypothetical protein
MGDDDISQLIRTFVPILIALLAEAGGVLLVLGSSRKPGWFVLWLMGIHALVFSAIALELVWLSISGERLPQSAAQRDARFDLAVWIGVGLGVLIEGILIYLICRFRSSPKSELPMPLVLKCLFASFLGNVLSVATLLISIKFYDFLPVFFHSTGASD